LGAFFMTEHLLFRKRRLFANERSSNSSDSVGYAKKKER